MKFGFVKVACVTPKLKVCDCVFNADEIIKDFNDAVKNGAEIVVFPELSITGYTCGDLFFQQSLLDAAENQLKKIISASKNVNSLLFAGLPVCKNEGIYNCAAAILNGKLLALIAKSYLPNYGEFYERRQFVPFENDMKTDFMNFAGFCDVPFGTDILFKDKRQKNLTVACEICEDLWVPVPPSSRHALAGATVIVNLSAGNEIIGKAEYRRNLVKSHSAKILCGYVYANAGKDESTQDMVFSGHNLIAENGTLLAQSELFENQTVYAEIDAEKLCQERRRTTSFAFSANNNDFNKNYLTIEVEISNANATFNRFVDPHPFVPSDKEKRRERCLEVISLQAQGLAKRLRHINCESAVIGLSGGLDSALALLITCRAFDLTGIPREKITALTMPCFGTTDKTRNNARELAKECGVALKEINIAAAVKQHFADIGQDEKKYDITYENSQARERTQILMDYANKTNGIVIGTGDLSELALGWCTYNGDQMSMYGVNSSVPKTLVRYLVEWFASEAANDGDAFSAILKNILETPVSPELLPPQQNGKISQITENLVGPYELHDFILYYVLRFGFSPSKIFFLAQNSALPYDDATKIKWFENFYKRFFSQQFKRSCMPDGAKVGTVNLSPRGDWRMPSDAVAAVWLQEIQEIKKSAPFSDSKVL